MNYCLRNQRKCWKTPNLTLLTKVTKKYWICPESGSAPKCNDPHHILPPSFVVIRPVIHAYKQTNQQTKGWNYNLLDGGNNPIILLKNLSRTTSPLKNSEIYSAIKPNFRSQITSKVYLWAMRWMTEVFTLSSANQTIYWMLNSMTWLCEACYNFNIT